MYIIVALITTLWTHSITHCSQRPSQQPMTSNMNMQNYQYSSSLYITLLKFITLTNQANKPDFTHYIGTQLFGPLWINTVNRLHAQPDLSAYLAQSSTPLYCIIIEEQLLTRAQNEHKMDIVEFIQQNRTFFRLTQPPPQ